MYFCNPYLTEIEKANLLQRWIIVHSILYYVMDKSVVEDRMFDSNERQLVELMKEMPEKDRKRTRYWYAFYDFDGSTGFHLYKRLHKEDNEYLTREADTALRLSRMNFRKYI